MSFKLTKEEGDAILKEDNGAVLLEIAKQVENFQDEYILTHDVYLQTPPSHVAPPLETTAADNIAATIPTKGTSWADFPAEVGNLPFSVELHEYVTPTGGKGYQTIMRREVDGIVQMRSIGYGVESAERTYDWKAQGAN